MSDIVKKTEYLTKYTPKDIKTFGKIDSIKKAVESETVSLAILKKLNSEKDVIDYIMLWIVQLNKFLNISRKMTLEQIKRTAEYILQDYSYLKQSDLYFIFSQAEKGHCGEFYDCLDGAKILSWFKKYKIERAKYVYDEEKKKEASPMCEKVCLIERNIDKLPFLKKFINSEIDQTQ